MNENEAITVTLTLENDEELECAVLSIFVDIDTSPRGSHPYISIVGNTYC